jgi:hypothetical protein
MYLQSAERYDPREGFWTQLPRMRTRRGSHSVVVLGDSLHALGGLNRNTTFSSVEIFDTRANSWRRGSPLSVPRAHGCAVTLDGNAYLIGGIQSSEEYVETVSSFPRSLSPSSIAVASTRRTLTSFSRFILFCFLFHRLRFTRRAKAGPSLVPRHSGRELSHAPLPFDRIAEVQMNPRAGFVQHQSPTPPHSITFSQAKYCRSLLSTDA